MNTVKILVKMLHKKPVPWSLRHTVQRKVGMARGKSKALPKSKNNNAAAAPSREITNRGNSDITAFLKKAKFFTLADKITSYL